MNRKPIEAFQRLLAFVYYMFGLCACLSVTAAVAVTPDASLNTTHDGVIDSTVQFSLSDLFNLQVITTSRKAESRDKAPNVTYVITKEQIAQRGYKNIYELLQTIPGYVITIKNIGDYMAQVRGIAANDNEKITIMINGHSISNLQEPILLDGPINLDNAERVEVIVGPGSVLYGANTLGSIINIITKEQDKNEVTFTAGPGYGHYNGTAMFAKKTENASIMGSFSAMHRGGWNAWPGDLALQLTPKAGDKMGSKPESFFGFGRASVKEWTLQAFTINDNDPELDLLSYADKYTDARRYDYIDGISAENNKFWNDNWGANLAVEYVGKRMARVPAATNTAVGGGLAAGYDLQQRTYKAEAGLRYKTEKMYAQAGIQASRDQNRHCYNIAFSNNPIGGYDSAGHPISSVDQMIKDTPTVAVGGYASGEYSLLENLKITLAFRLDHFSWMNSDSAQSVYFSPRAAVVYSPLDFWTTKLMYNTATHTADFGGTWGMNQIWGRGNPVAEDLIADWTRMQPLAMKPEVMQTFEWSNIFYVPKTRIALNGYYTTLDDFITWFYPVTNSGKFEGYGAELEVMVKPTSKVSLWANMAANHTVFTPTWIVDSATIVSQGGRWMPAWGVTPSNEILGVPRFTAAFGTDWEIIDHLFLNPSFRTMFDQPGFKTGAFKAKYGNSPSAEAEAGKKDYYTHMSNFFFDAAISYTDVYFKGLDMGFAVKNVLNNQEEQSQSFNSGTNVPRGRTIDLTARYTF